MCVGVSVWVCCGCVGGGVGWCCVGVSRCCVVWVGVCVWGSYVGVGGCVVLCVGGCVVWCGVGCAPSFVMQVI